MRVMICMLTATYAESEISTPICARAVTPVDALGLGKTRDLRDPLPKSAVAHPRRGVRLVGCGGGCTHCARLPKGKRPSAKAGPVEGRGDCSTASLAPDDTRVQSERINKNIINEFFTANLPRSRARTAGRKKRTVRAWSHH